jgi:hypothetical protein
MRPNNAVELTATSVLRWLVVPSSHCSSAAAHGERYPSRAQGDCRQSETCEGSLQERFHLGIASISTIPSKLADLLPNAARWCCRVHQRHAESRHSEVTRPAPSGWHRLFDAPFDHRSERS